MFGIDVVVEKGTGHHVVVDINYFPGKFVSSTICKCFIKSLDKLLPSWTLVKMFFFGFNFFTMPS